MKRIVSILVIFTVAATTWSFVSAETLDQENTPLITNEIDMIFTRQEITAGITGPLGRAEFLVSLNGHGDFTLTARVLDGLVGSLLGTAPDIVINSTTSGRRLVSFDFSDTGIEFTAGDQFVIAFAWTCQNACEAALPYNNDSSLYDGGNLHFVPPGGGCCSSIVGDAFFRTFVGFTITSVDLDIKPGSYPNSINLSSAGATPVAILGSAQLDVYDIDTDTLALGTAGIKTVGKKDRQLCSIEDVSGDFTFPEGSPDGFDDLVCHFITVSIAPEDGDTTATLSGNFTAEAGGGAIEGTDSVNIVP